MADERWNGNGSGDVLFTNVRVLDATGEYPYTGEVLVQAIPPAGRSSNQAG